MKVSARNILFMCLDSARYDTFEAAKTPNMSKIGETQRVYSPASFTQASIFSYFWGYPPIGTGKRFLFPNVGKWTWAPKHLSQKGYVTAWLSANPVLLKLDLGGQFRRYFKYFKRMGYDDVKGTAQIIEDLKHIVEKESTQPLFISILLLDTHNPYYDGEKAHRLEPKTPRENFENQKRAVEYIDKCFPEIIKPFNRPTDIIITSDHGELFGPHIYGHDSRMLSLKFNAKLFEIPFIAGQIG